MGLDMYIHKKEVKETEEDCAYWRKNWDLMEFFRANIHKYDSEEYDDDIELTQQNIIDIINFLPKNDVNLPALKMAYYDLGCGEKIRYTFNASW